MTNEELINQLQQFPKTDIVDFMLFAESTPRRGDADDSDVMIKRNHHQGRIGIMVNLPKYFERDIIESNKKMEKFLNERRSQ